MDPVLEARWVWQWEGLAEVFGATWSFFWNGIPVPVWIYEHANCCNSINQACQFSCMCHQFTLVYISRSWT